MSIREISKIVIYNWCDFGANGVTGVFQCVHTHHLYKALYKAQRCFLGVTEKSSLKCLPGSQHLQHHPGVPWSCCSTEPLGLCVQSRGVPAPLTAGDVLAVRRMGPKPCIPLILDLFPVKPL